VVRPNEEAERGTAYRAICAPCKAMSRIRRKPHRKRGVLPSPGPPDPPPDLSDVPLGAWSEKRRSVPLVMRARVIERDALRCYLCGRDVLAEDVHIDHIIPVRRGGQTALENLGVTHARCNISKSARLTYRRPTALVGVDCAGAIGPPEYPRAVRERMQVQGALDGTTPHKNKRLDKWRPR